MHFSRIKYSDLNGRQQESYNYHKVSGVLADYGLFTIRLSDDWNGADFIAQAHDGSSFLPVQLKGRFSVYQKYRGKNLWIVFPNSGGIYLYPHDEVLEATLKITRIQHTKSWKADGGYSFRSIPKKLKPVLDKYFLKSSGLEALPQNLQ